MRISKIFDKNSPSMVDHFSDQYEKQLKENPLSFGNLRNGRII